MDLVKWKGEMDTSILRENFFQHISFPCGQDKERDNLCFIQEVAIGKWSE
jgi:hypothetical protein